MMRPIVEHAARASLLALLLLPGTVAAQERDPDEGEAFPDRAPPGWSLGLDASETGLAQAPGPSGLLGALFAPARLRVRHEISFAVSTYRGDSASRGRYLSRIDYSLAPNLLLELDVGLETTSASGWTTEGTRFVVPSLSLTYRPTRHTLLRIEYGTGSPYGAPGLYSPRFHR